MLLDAAAATAAGHGPQSGEGELTAAQRFWFIAISILLVLFAGVMAGLTLGLLTLDK